LAIVQAFWDLIDSSQRCTRPNIRDNLLAQRPFKQLHNGNKEALNSSINLALRVWITLNLNDSRFSPAMETINWDDDSTIQQLVASQFRGPRLNPPNNSWDLRALNNEITAVNLSRLGGISIHWTYNLKDHLRFDPGNRRLWIYGLEQCIYSHKKRLVLCAKDTETPRLCQS
jgi:hypothetical protein